MPFPVTRSILSADALVDELLSDYDIGMPLACTFLAPTTNDTYRVDAASGIYVLRIYRAGRRSLSDVRAELDALIHLRRKGVSVSSPIAGRDGDLVRVLDAPEGPRYAVLFSYAPGRPRPRDSALDRSADGRLLADIHAASDNLPAPPSQVPLDLTYLLDQPLASLNPFLDHRPNDRVYLANQVEWLRNAVGRLSGLLDWGFCHGDYHGWNIHLADDQHLTVFDFECCGFGFRAWDLATYRWSIRRQDDTWSSFLHGYSERRQLREADRTGIPLFVAIREIWLLGNRAANARDWGALGVDERVDAGLAFLREWRKDN